ncbi:hypothetical protein ACGFZ3_13465 [Stenotrophomonas sp. NPDC047960]|uniref:hypothetical protein n=1 Tax=Stenotrophomonas sp. NPDC047960 TaxID=3364531 RepID=UPI00371F57E0
MDNIESWAKLVAPIVSALLIAGFKWYTEGRPRVISYLVQSWGVLIADGPDGTKGGMVHSHSIVVANIGRKPATGVRVTHSIKDHLPAHAVHPPTQYTIERNPEGYPQIVFPVLVPKQEVTISYLYFPPLFAGQILGNVLSNEGMARILQMVPTPKPNRFVSWATWILATIGGSVVVYWLFRLIIWLALYA